MARYIDADALPYEALRMDEDGDWYMMLDDIKNAPTADVAPVVHGRWIVHEDEYGICASEITCSVCKQTYCSSEYTDSEFIDNTRFCPDCGAKMDGGEEE